MVVIGIDPHKGSHTAVAIDEDEAKLSEVKVRADRRQLEGLLKWAIEFPERFWAIESAGVGPISTAVILAHSEDVGRFRSPDDYASYNGTAPVDASSGPIKRHRLNPRGNRQLNHAMHIIAFSRLSHPGPGRDYYDAQAGRGKDPEEGSALAQTADLQRRLSTVAHRRRQIGRGPGRASRGVS